MSRVHFLMTAAVAALLVVCAAVWYASRPTLPPEIRIAAGRPGGLYHTFAQDLARRLQQRTGRPVRVIETAGSGENARLLRDGGAELALIQTTSLTPEGVAGVAPLFPEPLHFLVRKGSGIRSPADLVGRKVGLGMPGSGIRQNANVLLPHYGVSPDAVKDVEDPFGGLTASGDVDAALVTTGWMNPILEKVLRGGNVELIGLADPEGLAARHPWLVPTTIPRGLYSGNPPVPPDPVRTVAVTALLTTRADATDELVRESLGALYETDLRSAYPVLLSAKAARDYDAAVMHPAAAMYHDPSARFHRLSQAMELASKSKEVLVGLAACAVLTWGWVRRRRERIAEAADRAQKQKLEVFIGRTLTVELEQMEVTDPEQLRPFLRRVTHIKQEALQELTSERVRGDQLFAIFLSQCAALSEKIQMRMIYGRLPEARVDEESPAADAAGGFESRT
jgi:TRAP transporter TAXI family solute receptor